ncbi:MAG: hypothetical protein LBF08_05190 [Dysgonamonadaceae bacterium]|jgi:hypothetical protein|nr:hypothetical protein [Dysgonamonadaceae bacterium]
MEQTGISIERNSQGVASYIHIDLSKCRKNLQPFFKEMGIEDEVSLYNPEFVKKIEKRSKAERVKIDYHNIWK